jgi:hypothetical protein
MADQDNTDDDEADDSSSDAIRDITLEEARRRYDDEEARRYGVEGKIGTIITVDALIISIVGIFSDVGPYAILSMVAALLSVGLGLWTLRTRDYNRPGKPIDDFLQYGDMTAAAQRKQVLFDYIVALDGNETAENPEVREVGNKKRNDTKYTYFDICVLLTGVSLALILAKPVTGYLATLNFCG